MLSNLAICSFEGRVGRRKVSLRARRGVSYREERHIAFTHPRTPMHTLAPHTPYKLTPQCSSAGSAHPLGPDAASLVQEPASQLPCTSHPAKPRRFSQIEAAKSVPPQSGIPKGLGHPHLVRAPLAPKPPAESTDWSPPSSTTFSWRKEEEP